MVRSVTSSFADFMHGLCMDGKTVVTIIPMVGFCTLFMPNFYKVNQALTLLHELCAPKFQPLHAQKAPLIMCKQYENNFKTVIIQLSLALVSPCMSPICNFMLPIPLTSTVMHAKHITS